MKVVSLFRGKDYRSVSQVLCGCRLESSGRNCARAELEGGGRGTVILQPSDLPSSPSLDWLVCGVGPIGSISELRCKHFEQREVPTGCSWPRTLSKDLTAEAQAESQLNQENTARLSHGLGPNLTLCNFELCHLPSS